MVLFNRYFGDCLPLLFYGMGSKPCCDVSSASGNAGRVLARLHLNILVLSG